MNTMIHAYRTKCIPNRDDRLDTLIPSEYMGQELEIISPGHLPNNLSVENILYGNSNIRNPIFRFEGIV
jgi:hypothetical protein